jgi:hypothetical protein
MVLVGKPERKSALGRPRSRWEDNIKFMFKKWYGACSGFVWLRKGTGGGLL